MFGFQDKRLRFDDDNNLFIDLTGLFDNDQVIYLAYNFITASSKEIRKKKFLFYMYEKREEIFNRSDSKKKFHSITFRSFFVPGRNCLVR